MPQPQPQIPFSDLLDAFDVGVTREAQASNIAVPDTANARQYIQKIYGARHARIDPPPASNVTLCAQVLGQIAFAMFRAELPPNVGNPHIPHIPIDPPPAVPTVIETRHVDCAREMYGFYTNSSIRPALVNPLLAPIPVDKNGREVDQPCPLCP